MGAMERETNTESGVVLVVGFLMVLPVIAGVAWLLVSGVRWLWDHPLF